MSVQGTAPGITPSPFQSLQQQQQAGISAPAPANRASRFDTFQVSGTQPYLRAGWPDLAKSFALHPFQTAKGLRKLPAVGTETRLQRLKMYLAVRQALGRDGRQHLNSLLKEGVLNDAQTDDGHSTLYHLYGMLSTRRANGLDNEKLLHETVRILNRPYLITQKFGPLSETMAQQILQVRNNPGLNRAGEQPSFKPLSWQDLNVDNSATCVSSSVMYYMADKKPGELARHLNELTSPASAFYEKVKLSELSPQDPQAAYQILQDQQIRYYQSAPDEVMVRVELPQAGLLRAVNNNQQGIQNNVRTGIETAYQSALTYLATRSYDPATDLRDADAPGETSKGLTEPEKTLMETIIKDNGGVQSITYQTVGAKSSPAPGEEGMPFLYGYTRTYEQTCQDMLEALQMGEFVIIGITDTDEAGSIAGGHEITITSAFVDQKDGELKFVVADSDDDIPTPVVRSARELIPRIHHAGLPLKLAEKIQGEIDQLAPRYYVPDQNDTVNFQPIPFVSEPLPADQVPGAQEAAQQAEAAASQQAGPTPGAEPVNATQAPGVQSEAQAETQAFQPESTTAAATLNAPAGAPAQPQYVLDYIPVQVPSPTMPTYAAPGFPGSYSGYPGLPYSPFAPGYGYQGGYTAAPGTPWPGQQPWGSYPPNISQAATPAPIPATI